MNRIACIWTALAATLLPIGVWAGAQTGTSQPVPTGPNPTGNVYHTDDWGQLSLTRWEADVVEGSYTHENGRFVGTRRGNQVDGYWYQPQSARACEQPRNGTVYYGRMTYAFSGDFGSFEGFWSYCDETPYQRWDGRLLHRGAAASMPAAASVRPPSAPDNADNWQPMMNVDLFGSDLREVSLSPGDDWRVCRAACDGDRNCRAWTYVVPGRQPNGECFLKDSVPEPSVSDCCISGVKGAPSSNGAAGQEAIDGPGSRIARRVGDAVERRAGDEADEAANRLLDRIF